MKTRQILLPLRRVLILTTLFCLIIDTHIPSSPFIPRSIWVLYEIHLTKPDYDRAFEVARRYILDGAYLNSDGVDEYQLLTVVARIYYVKEEALKKLI